MKRAKTRVKVAIASALAISSTAAVIYAAPEIMKAVTYRASEEAVYLDVEKLTSSTVKVSLDNIEDIAKSMQFSIKLDGNVKIKANEDGTYKINDLLTKTVESRAGESENPSEKSIFTDYTYNEADNTLDVIITSDSSLPKTGNKVELFTLEIEAKNPADKTYKIIPDNDELFKYVSKDNTEYSNLAVNYSEKSINLNTAPKVTVEKDVIDIYDGDKLVFDEIEGLKKTDDDENDTVTLEVRDITNITDESKEDSQPLITEFTSEEVGTHTFKVYAVDNMGEKSEPIKLMVNVKYNTELKEPTITGAQRVEIQSGTVFDLLQGVTATDAKGRELKVDVTGELNLNPETDTTYKLTYSATDKYGKTTKVEREVVVKANKAPVINGADNKVINIGENFDPKAGVTVTDDIDDDATLTSQLSVDGKVNTAVPGEYKLNYSVTDSGKKTTRLQRTVRVNRAPVVSGHDSAIVIKSGTEVTEQMILGGIDITDETNYTTSVKIPTINGEGRYDAEITVTDEDKAVTTVTRKIVVTNGSTAELPNSGQGSSKEDAITLQVIDNDGITLLNEKLSKATKDYKITSTKKEFSNYVQYSFEIIKKEAVFRNSDKVYLEVRVPKDVYDSTGGIVITEYVEILATNVSINNKENLNHYISIGDEIELIATVTPDNATNKSVDWETSNEDVIAIEKTENGVKLVAKDYGIATIKVGAEDGSGVFDEYTFSVSHNFKELPDDVTVLGGEGTEQAPVVYKTENIDSLKELLDLAKDEYKVMLQDKETVTEDEVEYKLVLKEKNSFLKLLRSDNTDESSYYISVRVPNSDEFENELYKLTKNDIKAPTLIYNGESQLIVENGSKFEIPEVKAKDNLDKNVTVSHVIKDENGKVLKSIDTTIEGLYTITYSATDSSGNKSSELIVEVNVLEADKEAPVFNYHGDKIIVLENGSEYIEPEVTAHDKVEGYVGVTKVINKGDEVVDSINTTIPGEYRITYTASDSKGNMATLEITVIVKEVENTTTPDVPEVPENPEVPDEKPETPEEKPQDKEAPIFDYVGETDVILENGQTYKIPEVKATDNVDGEVKVVKTVRTYDSNEIVESIDTNIAGKYTITYEAVDNSGNKANLVITVTVKAKMIVDNIELGNGEGTLESPTEINILETSSVENVNKLIENIKKDYDFEFIDEPKEDSENIIFKLKLQKKISFIRALFGKTSDENYIEIKVPKNNVEVVNVLKDLYESTNKPEEPETPEETPEIPEQKPETPEEKPEVPEEKPEIPEETPEVPEQKPETPEEKPEVPEEKPETPEEKPQDKEAPIFDYVGETDVILENGQTYKIPEVKATDNVDGEVKVVKTVRTYDSNEIVESIDTNIAGKYTITYEAVDNSGNKANLVITVTVKAKMIVDNIELGNGEGTLESPTEINILETSSVENVNKLIENIKKDYDFKFIDEPKEDGENIIFKIKLQKKISFIKALFSNELDENYIEIKVPKTNEQVVNVLNDLYKSTNEQPQVPDNSEKPVTPNTPEKPDNSEKPNTSEEKPNNSEKPNTSEQKPDTSDKKEETVNKESSEKNNKEDNKSIPKTGGVNSLGIIGLGSTILTLGGLLTFKKKNKK